MSQIGPKPAATEGQSMSALSGQIRRLFCYRKRFIDLYAEVADRALILPNRSCTARKLRVRR